MYNAGTTPGTFRVIGLDPTSALADTAPVVVTSPPPGSPGTVTNLAVTSVTTNAVTLSFTEVTDGSGQPASYDVRFAAGAISWGAATPVAQGTCATPLAGSPAGATQPRAGLALAPAGRHPFPNHPLPRG